MTCIVHRIVSEQLLVFKQLRTAEDDDRRSGVNSADSIENQWPYKPK